MAVTKLEIKKGAEVSAGDLEVINKFRLQEFHSDTLLEPGNRDKFREHIFFLLKDPEGNILAFGRLKQVKITFKKKAYDVWGIAMIVATVKGKGYGKILMQGMKQNILESGKTAVGFCANKNSKFYRKSGYGILPAASDRFFYKNPKGDLVANPEGGDDVIYLEGHDNLPQKIIDDKQVKVITNIPHW